MFGPSGHAHDPKHQLLWTLQIQNYSKKIQYKQHFQQIILLQTNNHDDPSKKLEILKMGSISSKEPEMEML